MENKEKDREICTTESLRLTCEMDDVLTYAIVHNGGNMIRDICIKNISENDLVNLTLKIKSSNELIEDFELGIDKIKPEDEIHIKNPHILVNVGYLSSLTERSLCQLTVEVYDGEKLLVSETANITVLAFDQWPGLQYTPELLAAFVMPNHPMVTSLLQLAANYLEKWTQDPSLAGYQYLDPNRVRDMAAAAYAAVQQKNITYAEPPSSFEKFGQRIRLADAVMNQHLGTCMDMTLLYVACLEAMGLNPVMIMMKGHIFAGVWLVEESFSDMIVDDPSQMEKRMSKGIHEMIVVECTAMCAGKSRNFDQAVKMAEHHVSDYGNFAFAIDVRRARSMGIRPLPVRVKTDTGFEVQHEDREEKAVTGASESRVEIFDLPSSMEKSQISKVTQWERKLLDLSLRNMLINMRMTKAVVPLLSSDVSLLEDALSDGEEFQVMPRPKEMSVTGDGGVPVEALGNLGAFENFMILESRHHRLHSLYAEKELNSCLTKMYRSARTSMEENGASTLYLALGLLRWFESKRDTSARYAPIVLVPVDIVRKSASKGYAMRMRDEDAQINITLLEFLKQSFDMQIYGLNPPPMDDHGLDLPKIFAIIRHAVMDYPMWDVVEVGFIGNFSFSQFVMWNDIHSNKEFLEKNKIVRSLIKGAVDWDCRIPESVDEEEAYLPVTVDSSQLRAINMASSGISFVLHGPPGTGKSQTITAMIANTLAKGKTVLFVAEKMAALEVVQKRLEALGIQDFCLELHSNKATKKAVLDQLKQGLENDFQGAIKTDYDRKIQEIRKVRMELDDYMKALHTKRRFGKSLRQLMDIYEMIPELGKNVHFDQEYAGSLTESDLDDHVYSLERLIAAGKGIGHPHDHPLKAVHKMEYNQRLKFDLESVIRSYMDSLEKLRTAAVNFAEGMSLEKPESENEWGKVWGYACSILAAEKIPPFIRNSRDIDREFNILESYLLKCQAHETKKTKFLSNWNENFLRMDMDFYRNKYEQANRKFFGKGKALAALTAELQAFAEFTVETDQIPVYLTDITFYQQDEKEISEAEEALDYKWKKILENFSTSEALREYKDDVKKQLRSIAQFADQIEKMETEGRLEICLQKAKNLTEDWELVKSKEAEVKEMLDIDFCQMRQNWMDSRIKLCACILENASAMKDWIIYQQYAAECRQKGLEPVCDAYEEGLSNDEVMTVYLRSIYRTIILSVIEREPVLNGFTGIGFNEKIAQFKKLDQECMALVKDELTYKLANHLPKSSESVEISKELNILRRAISSNGRGLSVRTLFEQIPHVLARLCPCMLMSPISAAQYLKAENNLFDIVIFDEASQMPTCKAVGVLARGKNAVIVGDPNQMPPTSFFAGNTIDEDNLDIEDLDSILDDCLALGMPSAYLQWHYRSRHESLIAFSNQEFYESSMLTFPSVNDREKRVRLVKTEGYFERGKNRVNRGEAKAIVDEIKRRYRDSSLMNQTIGVVTFNISQQTLIEDLLQEEYQKDENFDKWANTGNEALFVKNLENVQGDERDVILFSIAFGPDEEGKLTLNFGPLNKNGGWKRLNVAVSRARSEMAVFTTMTADMIDLRRTKSKGVESLKNFLEFAQKGGQEENHTGIRVQKEQGITEQICQAITEAGYQYQKAVGHSKFKIDIAVINPYNEEEYLLGIMLDGEAYRQCRNTKDREVAQISVLNGLGWEVLRIWTMDWWDNRNKEISKLIQILEEKKKTAYAVFLEKQSDSLKKDKTEIEDVCTDEWEDTNSIIQKSPELTNEKEQDDSEPGLSGEGSESIKTAKLNPEADTEDSREIRNPMSNPNAAVSKMSCSETVCPDDPISQEYRMEEYIYVITEGTELTGADYVKKENMVKITERIQEIIETEAPIAYGRLIRKTLRSFNIARSSEQTLEATEKALKKVSARVNKQGGVKFYWRKDQSPDTYRIFRKDTNQADKRSSDEISQQELKNAVCLTLKKEGALEKEALIKETIRTMGYGRSGAALTAAVERGLKYGRKTGEIIQDSEKKFVLSSDDIL